MNFQLNTVFTLCAVIVKKLAKNSLFDANRIGIVVSVRITWENYWMSSGGSHNAIACQNIDWSLSRSILPRSSWENGHFNLNTCKCSILRLFPHKTRCVSLENKLYILIFSIIVVILVAAQFLIFFYNVRTCRFIRCVTCHFEAGLLFLLSALTEPWIIFCWTKYHLQHEKVE